MPIKGLTTNRQATLPMIGQLFKGSPKKKKGNKTIQGDDLDHFRFESKLPDCKAAFLQVFGDKPDEIPIRLLHSDVDEIFPSWMEQWSGSRLQIRCDRECTSLKFNSTSNTYTKAPQACSYPQCGCDEVGRLRFIIPALVQAGYVGYVELTTHSKWDIIELTQVLLGFQAMGDLRAPTFTLTRHTREISTPGYGRQAKSLLYLTCESAWVQQHLAQSRQVETLPEAVTVEALPGSSGEHPALPASSVISEPQRTRLYTIASNAGLSPEQSKQVLARYGFDSAKDITRDVYDEIVAAIETEGKKIAQAPVPQAVEVAATQAIEATAQ